MTNPPIQRASPPDLTEVLNNFKRDILKSVNCVRIGTIISYDPGGSNVAPTAKVQIAQKQITSVAPDGTKTFAEYPYLLKVPVYFPNGGGFTLTFPVATGDECIILFNDRELDNWLFQGAGQPPTTARLHDLSDGICLVGLRSNPRALSSVSNTAAQLRSDDGKNFVEINSQGVKVHAGHVYEWDVNGYGQKITWTGGTAWTIDNYTIGATVTTNNHPISPPGPP